MINVDEFRVEIVRPILWSFDHQIPYSKAAENLLVGTALHESGLVHLKQLADGPALGFYQIEPATHEDVMENFLRYRDNLCHIVTNYASVQQDYLSQLQTNLAYATIIARLIYYRVPEALPEADDIEALAKYWKQHYNTPAGKGTAHEWRLKYLVHGV